jgi:hypothetical protein
MSTSLPCHSGGRKGKGGALRITAQIVSSSGASLARRRNSGKSCIAASSRCTTSPDKTSGPSGWRLNSKDVATPKLPPPPLSAQKRSLASVSLARMNSPSAVTRSADIRLSIVSPNLRVVQPKPARA